MWDTPQLGTEHFFFTWWHVQRSQTKMNHEANVLFHLQRALGGKNRATKYQKMFSTEQTEENILESSLAEDSYCVMKLSAGLQHSFFWGLIRADACHQFREFVLPVVTPAVEQSVRAGVYLASGYAKKYIFFLLATVILWAKALSQCSHILNTAQGRRILK